MRVMLEEIGMKRVYLPGVEVKWKCPSCGEENIVDYGDQPISHPSLVDPEEIIGCCCECDEEAVVGKLMLSLHATVVKLARPRKA